MQPQTATSRFGFFALAWTSAPDVPQDAHLRVLAHGAGVDDYQIGLGLVLREAVAHELYVPAQLLAVGLVLLAAVGVHQREGTPARGLDALAYLKAYLPAGAKAPRRVSQLSCKP